MKLSDIFSYVRSHFLIAALVVMALAVIVISPFAVFVLHVAFLPVKVVAPVFVLAVLLLVIAVAYIYYTKGKAAAEAAVGSATAAVTDLATGNLAAARSAAGAAIQQV